MTHAEDRAENERLLREAQPDDRDTYTRPVAQMILAYVNAIKSADEDSAEQTGCFVLFASACPTPTLHEFGMAGFASFVEWYWEQPEQRVWHPYVVADEGRATPLAPDIAHGLEWTEVRMYRGDFVRLDRMLTLFESMAELFDSGFADDLYNIRNHAIPYKPGEEHYDSEGDEDQDEQGVE